MKKITKRLLLLLSVCLYGTSGFAQSTEQEPCGYDRILQILEEKYPGFRAQYDKTYLEMVTPKVVSRKVPAKDTTYYYDTVFTIPVVFHVLYNTTAENIPDSLLLNQIDVLNEDYRRLNADTVKTRAVFKDRAGDVGIQFVLATTDPWGNSTNGIIRKYTSKTTFYTISMGEMKYSADGGDDAWDTKNYLNIWVCDMNWQGQDALLGFAYPPYGHPFWPQNQWVSDPNQGVVLHYKIVGRNNPLANSGVLLNSRKGRVGTHEVGHYLGLRHIWGDAAGCGIGDYIFDTPSQSQKSNFDCNFNQNTCVDHDGPELPDMVENYMDYSAHTCQNTFTHLQVLAMRNTLVTFRSELPISMVVTQHMKVIDTFHYDKIQIFASNEQKVVVEIRNEDLKQDLRMDVIDMTGQLIFQNAPITKNESWVNTTDFAPGVYFFHLKGPDNKTIKIEKLLILKN